MISRGLTLLEVLAALAVLVVLSALALPAVMGRMGDARVNSAARQVEAAVISARTQAKRESAAIQLVAVPDRQGMRLRAERVEASLAVEEAEEDDAPARGGRVVGRVPQGVAVMIGEAPAAEPFVRAPVEAVDSPIRIAVALPDGTMAVRGPVRLTAGGTGVVVTINRWTGVCEVARDRRGAQAPVLERDEDEWMEEEP